MATSLVSTAEAARAAGAGTRGRPSNRGRPVNRADRHSTRSYHWERWRAFRSHGKSSWPGSSRPSRLWRRTRLDPIPSTYPPIRLAILAEW